MNHTYIFEDVKSSFRWLLFPPLFMFVLIFWQGFQFHKHILEPPTIANALNPTPGGLLFCQFQGGLVFFSQFIYFPDRIILVYYKWVLQIPTSVVIHGLWHEGSYRNWQQNIFPKVMIRWCQMICCGRFSRRKNQCEMRRSRVVEPKLSRAFSWMSVIVGKSCFWCSNELNLERRIHVFALGLMATVFGRATKLQLQTQNSTHTSNHKQIWNVHSFAANASWSNCAAEKNTCRMPTTQEETTVELDWKRHVYI